MNTKSLYQEVILDHNRKPRNYGTLDHASHHAVGHNPLCGDRLDIALKLDGEQINHITFQGESCAICKASASMMTTAVKGKSRADAETLIQEFREMAMGKLALDRPNHLGRLTVFSGIQDLPTRVKCAILPWHTLHAALNSMTSISTETDDSSLQTTPDSA
ncbi:nitrogen fixation protein NifU [Nitrosomonas cryotolerans]|uniref:Nitrogen fixation protein NifU n=1 Tax=Nitrosomonas cryotolerans ATCC 49181 TaxID=1131553 RepID=A0A1N6ICX2_9PROT|nr:SUF system NifU family Fe-S cluster assembly protein [Nitrosomonas cryotolerans]SFP60784.1 nitrogen fixation protein NifU [Nitrosomonas cryotolerans]SIO29888.1 nitrogen fixation protein NifU [Nitrosomonas cryotolerans ATCC 49181]